MLPKDREKVRECMLPTVRTEKSKRMLPKGREKVRECMLPPVRTEKSLENAS